MTYPAGQARLEPRPPTEKRFTVNTVVADQPVAVTPVALISPDAVDLPPTTSVSVTW
jgi:hypothetical protein